MLLVIDLIVFIDFSERESRLIQFCLGKYRKIIICNRKVRHSQLKSMHFQPIFPQTNLNIQRNIHYKSIFHFVFNHWLGFFKNTTQLAMLFFDISILSVQRVYGSKSMISSFPQTTVSYFTIT